MWILPQLSKKKSYMENAPHSTGYEVENSYHYYKNFEVCRKEKMEAGCMFNNSGLVKLCPSWTIWYYLDIKNNKLGVCMNKNNVHM